MKSEASFQEILESKIKTQSPSPSTFQSPDPAHLAYLMGHIGQTFFRPPPQHRTTKIYPSRPKPPPPPHSLTEEQQLAAGFFKLHGIVLNPAFSQKELKKAFRTLALRLHPDMNKGAGSAFILLKSNFETLNELVS
jgi:hypothetical protein